MVIKLIHHTLPGAWGLVEDYFARVDAFCTKYDSDINTPALLEYLRMSFISQKPTALMIGQFDESGKMTGHLLALAERWFGRPVVTVVQIESEAPVGKDIWQQAETALKLFCYAHDAELVQITARNKAVARLFRRHGFSEKAVLMKRPVEGRAVNPSQ